MKLVKAVIKKVNSRAKFLYRIRKYLNFKAAVLFFVTMIMIMAVVSGLLG